MNKHFYYIGVIEDGRMKFVTKIDNTNRMTYWSDDEVPLAVSESVAQSIAEGLLMNLFQAVVIKSFIKLSEQTRG